MQPVHFTNTKYQYLYYPLLLLLLVVAPAGAQPTAGVHAQSTLVSSIDIPVSLSLDPLTEAAEKMLPYQAGNWHGWKDWHGIKSQYRAWRGPLAIRVTGDVLTVQAHIRYWIRARKKLLGVNLKGSCGIEEPPRQAVIGIQVRLGWDPDWTLRPQFRLLPTRFLDRCEMTIADIDVTPLVEKEFRKQMKISLRAALGKLAPHVHVIRQQAERTWSILHEPISIGENDWLMLQPIGAALSQIKGQAKHLKTHLAISLQPALVTGARPADTAAPLPPLARYYPHTAGLNLQLAVDLDFARLNQHITDTLGGQSFVVNGHSVGIKRVELGGSGQKVRARLDLSGELAGTAELTANLDYDAPTGRLKMRDLTYDYAAEDFAVGFLAKAFHEQIRQLLEQAANHALQQKFDQLNERLGVVLKKITPGGMTLDMSGLRFSSVEIQVIPEGIRLDGTASGAARLQLQ
ncbi:MAG: DUF4403 family protein [Gammaproteobacteria bacterium]|nr:DUF4403 family protein [Gammaproteobacteria bacterium]